jgi:broad specificity phosphatase PhoE
MHHITLLRHAESEGNSTSLLQGQSDYPLTLTGIEQTNISFLKCWLCAAQL